MRAPQAWVYIMASPSRRLYSGVTTDLHRRVWQHRHPHGLGFTTHNQITRLVYCEPARDIGSAIAREQQLKACSREQKLSLIASVNPGWLDLAADWFPERPRSDQRRSPGGQKIP
jgi:putative endonuclease